MVCSIELLQNHRWRAGFPKERKEKSKKLPQRVKRDEE
jgi:hypothetical protein